MNWEQYRARRGSWGRCCGTSWVTKGGAEKGCLGVWSRASHGEGRSSWNRLRGPRGVDGLEHSTTTGGLSLTTCAQLRFDDKVVVVTGAGGGLGKACESSCPFVPPRRVH